MALRIILSRFMICVITFLCGVLFFQIERSESMGNIGSQKGISLPEPHFDSQTSVGVKVVVT